MATSRLEGHRKALVRRAKLVEERSKLQAEQRPTAGGLESRMAILAERLNKGERVLEKAHQFQSAKDRWEAYVRGRSSLEARISQLDRLTEFFGPDGAMMAQAHERIGSFAENLNRHLAAFGYACHFTLDPFEIRVVLSKDSGLEMSLKQLSESERFRFGIAFQVALATVTGIRFVVVDRADVLDKARRKLLTGMLVKSDLDQAIILATSDEPPPRSIPQGVKFLDLTTGEMRAEEETCPEFRESSRLHLTKAPPSIYCVDTEDGDP